MKGTELSFTELSFMKRTGSATASKSEAASAGPTNIHRRRRKVGAREITMRNVRS